MARSTTTHSVFTLPNLVSASRVGLAIGFMLMEAVPMRLALIAVASLSDFLDGWIARRTKVTSRFGALVDPVADRIFALGVVVSYVADGLLSPWQAILLMFRDVMSVIGWFVARNVPWLRPITFKARPVGKVVTVLQLAAFLAVLLTPASAGALVWLVGGLGFIASVDYTFMLWRERVRDGVTPSA